MVQPRSLGCGRGGENLCAESTLFGLTARCRFSIHLSLSEAERQAKHFVPELVVTWRQSLSFQYTDRVIRKHDFWQCELYRYAVGMDLGV